MQIKTYKYAGKMASGFKDTLYSLQLDANNICIITYADVDYPEGYRHAKQNACVMTADYGLLINRTGSGRLAGHETNAQDILDSCDGFSGITYDIKDWIKSQYEVKFDFVDKVWLKK